MNCHIKNNNCESYHVGDYIIHAVVITIKGIEHPAIMVNTLSRTQPQFPPFEEANMIARSYYRILEEEMRKHEEDEKSRAEYKKWKSTPPSLDELEKLLKELKEKE